MANTRQRWTAQAAQAELSAWKASALTMTEFCRRRGIRVERLCSWRRRLAGQTRQRGDAVKFVEATVTGVTPVQTEPALVLVLSGGTRVEIATPQRVDPAWLTTLIERVGMGH